MCHGSSIKLTQNIQGAKGGLFIHVKEERPRYHHCLHHLDRELPRLEVARMTEMLLNLLYLK